MGRGISRPPQGKMIWGAPPLLVMPPALHPCLPPVFQACKVHNLSRARSFAMERTALQALAARPHPAFPTLVGCNEVHRLLFTRPVVEPLGRCACQ